MAGLHNRGVESVTLADGHLGDVGGSRVGVAHRRLSGDVSLVTTVGSGGGADVLAIDIEDNAGTTVVQVTGVTQDVTGEGSLPGVSTNGEGSRLLEGLDFGQSTLINVEPDRAHVIVASWVTIDVVEGDGKVNNCV